MKTDIFDLEQESYAFIDTHFDSRFNEVPEKFLKIWHSFLSPADFFKTEYQGRYEYKIFLYALQKYCRERNKAISGDAVNAMFGVFQLMLCLPDAQKKAMNVNTNFRIFDFELYLKISEEWQCKN